ncbi:MAG: twin-arginine translocation signal domain-containing protein [Vicinamibacterales bacterium]
MQQHDEHPEIARDNTPRSEPRRPNRRDVMKLGAAAVISAVGATRTANAQDAPKEGAAWPPPVRTRAGYVYDAKRQGNGPMDDSSRAIVQ